jgi:hypothetical protein
MREVCVGEGGGRREWLGDHQEAAEGIEKGLSWHGPGHPLLQHQAPRLSAPPGRGHATWPHFFFFASRALM